MEQLKKNAFVVCMTAVGAAIVICFVVFVLGAWTEADTAKTNINNLRAEIEGKKSAFMQKAQDIQQTKKVTLVRNDVMITEEWARVFEDEKKHYSGSVKEILKYYQAMDAKFEQWFPGLVPAGIGGPPSPGEFVARYADETPKVNNAMAERKIEVGIKAQEGPFGGGAGAEGGFQWEKNLSGAKQEGLPDIQKRFWIQAKLAAALIAAKGVRLEKIDFIKVPDPGAGLPKPGDLPKMGPDIPLLGRTTPVSLTVQILYENIGDLVQALLATKMHAYDQIPKEDFIPVLLGIKEPPAGTPSIQFPLRIKKLSIAKTVTPLEEEKVAVPEDKVATWVPPDPPKNPVRVTVLCDIIDFEIADPAIEAISKVE